MVKYKSWANWYEYTHVVLVYDDDDDDHASVYSSKTEMGPQSPWNLL